MDKKNAIRRAKRPSKVLEENYWDCSVCTYRNNAEAFKCSMCDVRKALKRARVLANVLATLKCLSALDLV
ncbi:hypothetical protein HF086_005305 [Spodoptera exigua]|uniref:RanBP2-type domain-containing protein n=1 Tax=Spodoptera exigua TaxID=7107 RepID=A0A922MZK2_SPOEX|nr:hypothetical protein HF086_005305 [Spodoptera exigua]